MKIAILGSVGVPGCYGGFETLAENLVLHVEKHASSDEVLTVYCSARAYPERPTSYHGARLRYSRLNANGWQSILYDAITALDAVIRGHDRLLLLGVSGAIVIPIIRLISRARIITNLDGVEWKREKWHGFSRKFLKWSEAIAVRYSHEVIADNQGIADYLAEKYGVSAEVVAYGGDNAVVVPQETSDAGINMPEAYALALCRIEPENNIELILEAFSGGTLPLVFVGNWKNSEFGRALWARYANRTGLHLLDPVYEPGPLYALRRGASAYVHGHSAGGTNPSLVEMMHFAIPVMAFDCNFNRYTTENKAHYFSTADELRELMLDLNSSANGAAMKEVANRLYHWDEIGGRYLELLRQGGDIKK